MKYLANDSAYREVEVFEINDNAFAPHRARFEHARNRLPVAHCLASHEAVTHVHRHVVEAAEDAGLDSTQIVVSWKKLAPYVGIAHGERGDRLADIEYGMPDTAPNPVLRTAAMRVKSSANEVYGAVLQHELGMNL